MKTVCVMDDDPEYVEMLHFALESLGYRMIVATAMSRDEAGRSFSSVDPSRLRIIEKPFSLDALKAQIESMTAGSQQRACHSC